MNGAFLEWHCYEQLNVIGNDVTINIVNLVDISD